jgi:uncharacterized protein
MKRILTISLLLLLLVQANSQDSTAFANAKMKSYFFVLLKAGPDRSQDSITVQRIQEGHMANMNRLAALKKLVVAGPFLDDGKLRGLFFFDVPTIEEVEKLLLTDFAISSGRLSYEIHPWMTVKGACFN